MSSRDAGCERGGDGDDQRIRSVNASIDSNCTARGFACWCCSTARHSSRRRRLRARRCPRNSTSTGAADDDAVGAMAGRAQPCVRKRCASMEGSSPSRRARWRKCPRRVRAADGDTNARRYGSSRRRRVVAVRVDRTAGAAAKTTKRKTRRSTTTTTRTGRYVEVRTRRLRVDLRNCSALVRLVGRTAALGDAWRWISRVRLAPASARPPKSKAKTRRVVRSRLHRIVLISKLHLRSLY